MRYAFLLLLLITVVWTVSFAQMGVVTEVNGYALKTTSTLPDSLKPYLSDQGIRRVWSGVDLDNDGKQEILATDYSNNGRVHVFEWNGSALELVWSSQRMAVSNTASTPRWIQVGDLDGDGNKEIIFPDGNRYTGEIDVYEYQGTDNNYGTEPAFTLPATYFAGTLGANHAFRMDRERGLVGDFDGDGRDELMFQNQSGNIYILGVIGDFPGFASWQLEGGADAVSAPEGANFSGGAYWNSLFDDFTGSGKKEIVNHHWNHWAFWSIEPKGPDSYRYPTPHADSASNPNAAAGYHYAEYLPADPEHDAVSYMGVYPADVDGDGKKEITGIFYIGNDPPNEYDYSLGLVNVAKGDTGVYTWKGASQFGMIGQQMWTLAGASAGSHWGIATYDFDGDGKDEIYVGGSAGYNVIQVKYNGTGSLTDPNSYTKTIVYPGDKARYHWIYLWDSLGIKYDTTYAESPFLASIYAGSDVNGNGKKELVISYQSIADSITYYWNHYDTTVLPFAFVQDSVTKKLNTQVIDIRVLEWTGTGFKEIAMPVVTPDDYVLEQNYPNPFNPTTNIRFSLPTEKKISLMIYDLLGREVRTLIYGEEFKKGAHSVAWDGRNNAGAPVASGTYIYTLKFGNFTKSAKMALVR
jgi:hypothetical protein